MDLSEFAFHARRVNEFCALRKADFPDAPVFLVRISENAPPDLQRNYEYSLNLIVHAREFVLGYTHADHRKIFHESAANLIPLYARIKTDQQTGTISIFGIAHCFLNGAIPMIKAQRPELEF